MLVLRRKAGEAIVLNGSITIHVLAVEGERVKLGISAPPEVVIVRSELLENSGQVQQPAPASVREPREPMQGEESPRTTAAAEEPAARIDPALYTEPTRRHVLSPKSVAPAAVPNTARYR